MQSSLWVCAAFADDVLVFLNNLEELKLLLKILDEFGAASGLVLQLPKCAGRTCP